MKELYELDVALFGEERALGMWEFRWKKPPHGDSNEWCKCYRRYNPRNCDSRGEFRRRDDAPSIWGKAPEWARIVARCSEFKILYWCDHVGFNGMALRVHSDMEEPEPTGRITERQVDSFDIIARRPKTSVKMDDLMKPPHTVNMRCLTTPLPSTTIYRAPDLYAGATLLLQEPELVVWRDADGQLHHAPARDVLVNPDRDGLAAEVLSRMAGADIAPEHIAELRAQGLI